MEEVDKGTDSGVTRRSRYFNFPVASCCGSEKKPIEKMDDSDGDDGKPLVVLPLISASCCSSAEAQLKKARSDQSFVRGVHASPVGDVPLVPSELKWRDRWGSIKARWGVGRMDYSIDPGLYALGSPDDTSPVLVSANYKMSFDRLREALPGRDAWILVLDTKGINVWCAAGKGTFGTEELVRRIFAANLKDVVKHRQLILPQLGAPGVAAHLVKKFSGFRVHYGPIRAEDLPAYLDRGMKATPEMRCKSFEMAERAVLIPIELVEASKAALVIIPILMLVSGLLGLVGSGGFMQNVIHEGLFAAAAILGSVFAGAVLVPLFLPYLPGRAFSVKGFATGFLMAAFLLTMRGIGNASTWQNILNVTAWGLMICAISAYLAMNFTGASTYTSLSGVKREMRWALPLEGATGLIGLVVWMITFFIG
ncbi:MAG: mercury methylation corrinoid protein HgcA [Syntrophales bacterium]|nr:mercury methylation corrinoid protein HgcA [Syntrophales bacterium]